MKKLLLLDADVIIDLHTLGLFEKIIKACDVYATRTVLGEAKYFKQEGHRERISITDNVTVIDVVDVSPATELANCLDSRFHGNDKEGCGNDKKGILIGVDDINDLCAQRREELGVMNLLGFGL